MIAFFMLLFLAGSPATAAHKSGPADLVSRFYEDYVRYPHSGVPSDRDLEKIRPYLSDSLYRLLLDALHYQQDWIRRHPDRPPLDGKPAIINKPPLVDGPEWFTSLEEWPNNVRSLTGDDPAESFEVVNTTQHAKNAWHVRVRYAYATKPKVTWEDVFVVKRQHGRYVIDDVIYSGGRNFYRRGRLSKFIGGPWN